MAPARVLPLVHRRDIAELLDRARSHRTAATESADPAERWRHLALAEAARALALVSYLTSPGATVDGARNILVGRGSGPAAT